MREVLKLAAFRRLLAAFTLNQLAQSIGALALALLVYRRTGNAFGPTAYFLCAQFGPALISPALVARIDQLAVRRVLPALYAVEAIAYAGLAWMASRFSLAPVLALALVDGILWLAAASLVRAATVRITAPRGLLREGNALTNEAFSICIMAGPALGGLLVASEGTIAALLTVSGIFGVMTLTVATTSALPQSRRDRSPAAGRLRAALAYVKGDSVLRSTLSLQAVAFVVFAIAIPVEVVFAQRSLHAGAGGYAALLATWGAGAVAGSLMYARWRQLPGRQMMATGACLVGIGYLGMAVAPSLAFAIVGSVIGGIGNGIVIVALRTSVQEATQERWMTVTMSLNQAIFQASPGLGFLIGGALAALAGPRAAIAVAGAGSLVVTAAMWAILPSQLAPAVPEAARIRPQGDHEPAPMKAVHRVE